MEFSSVDIMNLMEDRQPVTFHLVGHLFIGCFDRLCDC
jgi:hypothetical protein